MAIRKMAVKVTLDDSLMFPFLLTILLVIEDLRHLT